MQSVNCIPRLSPFQHTGLQRLALQQGGGALARNRFLSVQPVPLTPTPCLGILTLLATAILTMADSGISHFTKSIQCLNRAIHPLSARALPISNRPARIARSRGTFRVPGLVIFGPSSKSNYSTSIVAAPPSNKNCCWSQMIKPQCALAPVTTSIGAIRLCGAATTPPPRSSPVQRTRAGSILFAAGIVRSSAMTAYSVLGAPTENSLNHSSKRLASHSMPTSRSGSLLRASAVIPTRASG